MVEGVGKPPKVWRTRFSVDGQESQDLREEMELARFITQKREIQ